MLTAVYFNNNLLFKTSEIENIILEWVVLSAKFQSAHLTAAQHPPEFSLGIGQVATQAALEVVLKDCLVRLSLH
jgi:hypothetical protein